MLREYRLDLHLHTCLSPCGDPSMVPKTIVGKALERKLDGIMIADHNSTENAMAVRKAAGKRGLSVFGGAEVCTSEELHVLALLDDPALAPFQAWMDSGLSGENDPEAFGAQELVDENGLVTGYSARLLIGALKYPVEEVVRTIHAFGGIAIASHVDKPAFSVLSQLGFVPTGLPFDAIEVSPFYAGTPEVEALKGRFPLVAFSDAHFPEEIGRASTVFLMEGIAIEEIRMALKNERGRGVRA